MASKTLKTRLKLKYDTYENWMSSTLPLLAGEIAIVSDGEYKDWSKVGEDGIKTFSQLDWATMTPEAINALLEDYATLESPALTGTPTAPTPDGDTENQIATVEYVNNVFEEGIAASDAMVFKGTLGTGGTVTSLPTTYKTGWTYRVITAGEYAGQQCEVGDLIIALVDRTGTGNLDSDWTIAQTNIEGNPIMELLPGAGINITANTGSTRTIGHSNSIVAGSTPGTAATLTFGGNFIIPKVEYDTEGHITDVSSLTMTMPANPNTHYTTHLIIGASDTATVNAAATNGNVWLNILDDTTVRDAHNIVGSGLTTVTSDADGTLTITTNHPTITTSNTTSTASPDHGETFTVIDSITTTNNGHVNSINTKTITLPTYVDNDTKNTAGATNTSSKIYLIGAIEQTANPQTYSHDTVYIDTDGKLYNNDEKVVIATDLNNYLPLTGGTITGTVIFQNEDSITINSTGITSTGEAELTGFSKISTKDLEVTIDATIQGNLQVTGYTTLNNNLEVNGDIDVNGGDVTADNFNGSLNQQYITQEVDDYLILDCGDSVA